MIDRKTNVKITDEALAFAKPMLSAAAVKLSKAKIRAIVFNKCGGKCAYWIFIIIFALWEQKQTPTF